MEQLPAEQGQGDTVGEGAGDMEVDHGQGSMGMGGLDMHDSGGGGGTHDEKGLGAADPGGSASKFQAGMKPIAQVYRVACLNCGAQLHVELPHSSGSFQCCQCHAVHKVIQDNFAMADQNKKRKRKDKPAGKSDGKHSPSSETLRRHAQKVYRSMCSFPKF